MSKEKKSGSQGPTFRQALVSLVDTGVAAGVLVALGAWLGSLLDQHLKSSPWFALGLALLGGVLGLARMVMRALQLTSGTQTGQSQSYSKNPSTTEGASSTEGPSGTEGQPHAPSPAQLDKSLPQDDYISVEDYLKDE